MNWVCGVSEVCCVGVACWYSHQWWWGKESCSGLSAGCICASVWLVDIGNHIAQRIHGI